MKGGSWFEELRSGTAPTFSNRGSAGITSSSPSIYDVYNVPLPNSSMGGSSTKEKKSRDKSYQRHGPDDDATDFATRAKAMEKKDKVRKKKRSSREDGQAAVGGVSSSSYAASASGYDRPRPDVSSHMDGWASLEPASAPAQQRSKAKVGGASWRPSRVRPGTSGDLLFDLNLVLKSKIAEAGVDSDEGEDFPPGGSSAGAFSHRDGDDLSPLAQPSSSALRSSSASSHLLSAPSPSPAAPMSGAMSSPSPPPGALGALSPSASAPSPGAAALAQSILTIAALSTSSSSGTHWPRDMRPDARRGSNNGTAGVSPSHDPVAGANIASSLTNSSPVESAWLSSSPPPPSFSLNGTDSRVSPVMFDSIDVGSGGRSAVAAPLVGGGKIGTVPSVGGNLKVSVGAGVSPSLRERISPEIAEATGGSIRASSNNNAADGGDRGGHDGGAATGSGANARSERVVFGGSASSASIRGSQIPRSQSSAAILGYRGGDLDVSLSLLSQINIHDHEMPVAKGYRSPIANQSAAAGGDAALDMPRSTVRDRPMSATGKSRVSSARALRPQPVKLEARQRNKSATTSRRIGGGGGGDGVVRLVADTAKDKDLRIWMRSGRDEEADKGDEVMGRPPSRQSNAFPMRLADPATNSGGGGVKAASAAVASAVLDGSKSSLSKSKHNRPTSRKKPQASSLFLSDGGSTKGVVADTTDVVDDDLIYDESGHYQQKERTSMPPTTLPATGKQQRQSTGWGGESVVPMHSSPGRGGDSVVPRHSSPGRGGDSVVPRQSSPTWEPSFKPAQGVVAANRDSPTDQLAAFDESDDDIEYFVSQQQPQRMRAKDERRDNPDRDGFSDLAESGLWTIKIEVTNSKQQPSKAEKPDNNNSSGDDDSQDQLSVAKPPSVESTGGFSGMRSARTIRTAPHAASSAFLSSQTTVPTPPETSRPETVSGTTLQFSKGDRDIRNSFVVAGDYLDAHTNGAFLPVSGKKTVWADENEDEDILLTSYNGDDGDLFNIEDENNEVARSASVAALDTNLGSDFLSLFAPSPPPMGRTGVI